MSNPIHQLKQAIRLRNWPMVCGVYEELSGETAPTPLVGITPARVESEPSQITIVQPTEEQKQVLAEQLVNAAAESEEGPRILEATMSDLAVLEETTSEQPYDAPEPNEGSILDEDAQRKAWEELAKGEYKVPVKEQKAAAQPNGRLDMEQFRIRKDGDPEPGQVRADGARYTRKVNVTPSGVNAFKDNLNVATKDLRHDKILVNAGVRAPQPTVETRPPVTQLQVQCRRCNKSYTIFPADAPQRIEEGTSSYVCNVCIREARSSRR